MTKPTRKRLKGERLSDRDEAWARLHLQGWSDGEIADRYQVTRQHVGRRLRSGPIARRIADARAAHVKPVDEQPWWLQLVPMFPVGSFTPASTCRHGGPIERGSRFVCMVCHKSGYDGHPALWRSS